MEAVAERTYERLMRRIFLSFVIALAGCTAQPAPIGSGRADELAGRIAGPPQSCVAARPTTSVRVIDAATLGYGSGRTIYTNRLRSPCPGLNPLTTIILDVHGSEYCSGDHFRTIETGSVVPGPVCFLGEWTPLTRP